MSDGRENGSDTEAKQAMSPSGLSKHQGRGAGAELTQKDCGFVPIILAG